MEAPFPDSISLSVNLICGRRTAVLTALCDTLGVLSDDEYEFTFEKLSEAQPIVAVPGLQYRMRLPDLVRRKSCLFSGGLDSLGGAIQEIIAGKSVALVSHRPVAKIDMRQKTLLA